MPPTRSPSVRFACCQLPRPNCQKYLETRKNFLIARLRLCCVVVVAVDGCSAVSQRISLRIDSTRCGLACVVLMLFSPISFVSDTNIFPSTFPQDFYLSYARHHFARLHCVCVWALCPNLLSNPFDARAECKAIRRITEERRQKIIIKSNDNS